MIFPFILGTIFASFFGLVIERFPEKSIITPRSHCTNCQTNLAWFDLIPILSQLSTLSHCRYCKHKIPYWYFYYELFLGILFVLTYTRLLSLTDLLLLTLGSILAIYDLKSQSYPLIIWLIFTIPLLLSNPLNKLFFLFIILSLLAFFKKLNIGEGDFLYLASLSYTFNLFDLAFLIQIASLIGITHFLFRKTKNKSIPFIPHLFISYIIILFIQSLLQ